LNEKRSIHKVETLRIPGLPGQGRGQKNKWKTETETGARQVVNLNINNTIQVTNNFIISPQEVRQLEQPAGDGIVL